MNFFQTPFTLYTDNKDTHKLLTSIRINSDGKFSLEDTIENKNDDKHQEKLRFITQTLAINLVYNIRFSDDSETPFFSFNFHIPKEHFSSIKNFKFSELFEKRQSLENNAYERLKDAYAQFHLGNFLGVISLCQEVSKMAAVEHSPLYFISQFNIVKMRWFLHNYYYGEDSQDDLIKEINLINLSEELAYYKESTDLHLLKLISEEQLIPQYSMKITRYRDAIRDSYHNKDRGFNENATNLVFDFYELTNFITLNCILVEDDAKFRIATTAFLEGVIASYASNDDLGGKIDSFDDTLLSNIIQYCTAKEIRSHLRRYKVQSLTYKQRTSGNKSFIDIFLVFLQDYKNVANGYLSQSSIKTHFFWNNYNKYFDNFLSLISFLDLPSDQIEKTAITVLENLRINKYLTVYDINLSIKQFLIKKGARISAETLQQYFHFFAFDYSFRDVAIIDEIRHLLLETGIMNLT